MGNHLNSTGIKKNVREKVSSLNYSYEKIAQLLVSFNKYKEE